MLGPLSVVADGTALALPASRKTRALFAYLAFSGEAVGRSRLCELLWEIPSDPRGRAALVPQQDPRSAWTGRP